MAGGLLAHRCFSQNCWGPILVVFCKWHERTKSYNLGPTSNLNLRQISSAVSTVFRVPSRPCSASTDAEHCGYGDLEWAAGVCGRCCHSMGIESVFACNMQNNKELT